MIHFSVRDISLAKRNNIMLLIHDKLVFNVGIELITNMMEIISLGTNKNHKGMSAINHVAFGSWVMYI